MVLWRLLPEVATPFGICVHGVVPLVKKGPPWVVERLLGVACLAAGRSAEANAHGAHDLMEQTGVTE